MEWELPCVPPEEDTQFGINSPEEERDSASDDPCESERRRKRLSRNRESARDSRKRKKQKLQLLESRVAELTEEVNRLRMATALATPSLSDDTFTGDAFNQVQSLSAALADPETTDQEINAILDEFETQVGVNGKSRVDALTKTFHQTMDMMIPMHVKFCLWVCGSDTSVQQPGPPKWEDLVLNTSLSCDQIAAFKEYQKAFGKEKVGLGESFDSLKRMMCRIVRHARSLHSLLSELRPLMKPRQVAHFAVWIHKYYTSLTAENSFDSDHNSPDLTNSE